MNYFITALDLQKNCEASTESSHIPHSQIPLLLTSYASVMHLLQWMKQ